MTRSVDGGSFPRQTSFAIQALERAHLTQPMRPNKVELQEFEYIRHGTQSLIANLEVATGQVIAPSLGATRTPCRLCNSH